LSNTSSGAPCRPFLTAGNVVTSSLPNRNRDGVGRGFRASLRSGPVSAEIDDSTPAARLVAKRGQ